MLFAAVHESAYYPQRHFDTINWCIAKGSIRGTETMEYWLVFRSVRLDVRRPDHLAPLLGFLGNELSEIGGRACKDRVAQVS
jgi:hypothetical protein